MPSKQDQSATHRDGPRTRSLLVVGAAVVGLLIALQNPLVLVLLLTDGLLAVVVLLCVTLAGVAAVPLLRLGPLPARWQVLLGAGLGLGLLSIVLLVLGAAGILSRVVWIALLAIGAGAGILRVRGLLKTAADQAPARASGRMRWLWLLVCPFLALTILAASVPPGYLWAEEGNGYDVLEYHLQMPKEYLAAGRIVYAPHNVYASFPANVEMLYLLCMVLTGDAVDAAGACKMLNAGLAVLIVAAAWLIGRERSSTAGVVTGVAAAGTGWLTYLSGVAYVENGMLFFGMLAVAAMLRAVQQAPQRLRWAAAAGLLAGFSMGCKYTAVVLVGLPLAVGLLVAGPVGLRRRLASVGVLLVAQVAAFAPWLVKNAVMTHDPVFPLSGRVFDGYPDGWGQPESTHFAATHAPGPDEAGIAPRLKATWHQILADPDQRFGPVLFILAAWGLMSARGQHAAAALGMMLLMQLLAWLFVTHLFARFAVPLLIPLVALAGWVPLESSRCRRLVTAALLVGAAWNGLFLTRLYRAHTHPGPQRVNLEGATGFFTAGLGLGHEHLAVINQELPADSRILMVGDAKAFYFRRQVDYCVVFNRSPFVTVLESGAGPTDVVSWMARRGYTHVLVNWSEIERLRSSRYGFPSVVTRDLFEHLTSAGLRRTHEFSSNATGIPYAELYRVPPGR